MNIEEVQFALKERYPTINFNLCRDKERIIARIYNNVKRVNCSVVFELEGQTITIYYFFGKIHLNYETLCIINELNLKSDWHFKTSVIKMDDGDYLSVQYSEVITSANEVPNILLNSNQALLDNSEFKELYKRVKDNLLSKTMN